MSGNTGAFLALNSLLLELPTKNQENLEQEVEPTLIEKCLAVVDLKKGKKRALSSMKMDLPVDKTKKSSHSADKQQKTKTSKQEVPFLQSIPNNTVKNRQKLKLLECQQFQTILQHPAFQQNPIETMQTHLKNVLACQQPKQQKPAQSDHQKRKIFK